MVILLIAFSSLFVGNSVLEPLDPDVFFNQNNSFSLDFRGSVSFRLDLSPNSNCFLLPSGLI